MMTHIGFTGSRKGMSGQQIIALEQLLTVFLYAAKWVNHWNEETHTELMFHHGAGPGDDGNMSADEEAARVAESLGLKVQAHPPLSDTAAAMLARDKKIAITAEVLIAAPMHDKEVLRSGTWSTIRYARTAGKPIIQLPRGR